MPIGLGTAMLGSSAIGAGAGFLGTSMSNSAAVASTKKQMEFQRYMSNTAYRRAAKDLEAAGLNRVLALGSPASTPAGSQATIADLGKSMTGGAQAGANTALTVQQAKQAGYQAKLDQEMFNTYKALPKTLKHVVNIQQLAEKTGADPMLLLGGNAANNFWKGPVGQFLKNPKNWGQLGEWYQSGGLERFWKRLGAQPKPPGKGIAPLSRDRQQRLNQTYRNARRALE